MTDQLELPKTPREAKATEAELTRLLERRHAKTGNGGSGEYAFMAQVRNAGGFDATRTFDAVAVSLWPSRGYTLHVYEVKVSKSDWKRELTKPDKAEDACAVADYFTIVAPRGCVDVNEVPPTWGFIEAFGGKVDDETGLVVGRKLRTVRSAPHLRTGKRTEFPAGFVIAMLRSAGAVPDAMTVSEKALADAHAAGRAETTEFYQDLLKKEQEANEKLRRSVREFEAYSGVTLDAGWRDLDIHATAKRVRDALENDRHIAEARTSLERLRDRLTRILDDE